MTGTTSEALSVTLPFVRWVYRVSTRQVAVLVALAYVAVTACSSPIRSPVVDNRATVTYYARVGGVADDRATARVIELPPNSRTSLERQVGLSDLFLTDITILRPDCSEIAAWTIDDAVFEDSIVISSTGSAIREEDDSGPLGSDAIVSDHCPAGPDILS
jgi:hypothetical protein